MIKLCFDHSSYQGEIKRKEKGHVNKKVLTDCLVTNACLLSGILR